MRIGVDLDGCVYNFTEALANYIYTKSGLALSAVPSCWEFYKTDWGMELDEYLKWFEDGVNAGEVFRTGEPFPDSVETLDILADMGHSLYIITDRGVGDPEIVTDSTKEWLSNWDIPHEGLIISSDKTSAPTDYFIDDRPKNVDALRAVGTKAFLLKSPPGADYPRKDQAGHPYLIDSWADFLKIIQEEDNSKIHV